MALSHPELPEHHLDSLVADGIAKVQEAYYAPFLRNASEPPRHLGNLLDDGLSDLEEVQARLGLERSLRSLPKDETYPKTFIVEGVLKSIAASPISDAIDRYSLTETWIQASSSGRGRTYPLPWIARHNAVSILDPTLKEIHTFTAAAELDAVVEEIDKSFLTTRVIKSMRAARHIVSRLRSK